MSNPAQIPTANYVTHYDPAKSHHRAWLQAVLDRLVQHDPHALAEGSELRDLWKAAVETKAPPPPAWLAPARKIVAEFEGCELEAYLCPAGVLTIGYGHTGPTVSEGMAISQETADAMLERDLARFAKGIHYLLPGSNKLGGNQQAALISWAFNVGLGAVETSTLRMRVRAGESYIKVVPEELPRWSKADGKEHDPGLTRRRAAEVALFAGRPGTAPPPTSAPPAQLAVPWFSQRDSKTDQALRMCFSSSCAMLLEFLKPGTLQGPNGDDQYLARVRQFGDTTDATDQIKALASYGIMARFSQQASFTTLEQQIAAGVPVPCGYLHRGPVSKPSGDGHWLIVVGITPTHVIVHDPFGEADLVNGTTLDRPARFTGYSRANWGRRWEVEGPGTGWAIIASAI